MNRAQAHLKRLPFEHMKTKQEIKIFHDDEKYTIRHRKKVFAFDKDGGDNDTEVMFQKEEQDSVFSTVFFEKQSGEKLVIMIRRSCSRRRKRTKYVWR